MESLVGLFVFGFVTSLCAGLVMICVRKWRSRAPWVFALSGASFLLLGLSTGGLGSLLAIIVLLTLIALGAGLLLFLIPRFRHRAKSLLKVAGSVFVASIAGFVYVIETTPETAVPQEISLAQPSKPEPAVTDAPLASKPALPTTKKIDATTDRSLPEPVKLQPSFAPQTMYVDASRLNVRDGPSKTDKVIWTLKNNEKVLIINREGSWAFLKADRYQGWVFATYLTPKPAQPVLVKRRDTAPAKVTSQPSFPDAKIAEILIKRSHAYYSGNCPCPYNRARNGSRCGKRSAYSRPGGESPLCYPRDVTATMITDYRARQ